MISILSVKTMEQKNTEHYLFYASLSYSFNVLRPLQKAIEERGARVCWFIPKDSEAEHYLLPQDERLTTIGAVKRYNAKATVAPGNVIPDFFPGLKVQVFHGLNSGKKNRVVIRNLFDLYCTLGPIATALFSEVTNGTCEIVETGWSKLDTLFTQHQQTQLFTDSRPTILYAPTFSPKLRSTYDLLPEISRLSQRSDWKWLIKLHPKALKEEVEQYKALSNENLTFVETSDIIPLLQASDVLLSDTSSVLSEFALLNKVVVTYKNRVPQPWMMNITQAEQLESTIEQALAPSEEHLNNIRRYASVVHPYTDGKSSERILTAIDSLHKRGLGHLKPKPLNLFRRLKLRKQLGYYHWH